MATARRRLDHLQASTNSEPTENAGGMVLAHVSASPLTVISMPCMHHDANLQIRTDPVTSSIISKQKTHLMDGGPEGWPQFGLVSVCC
ncbi:hypothetical protein BRADI_1g33616v3 [Brachypodium distachyon]|uniref:Uncharacterized protein n=1 Tax=Brachypodium distachyon TaxID=15368 RepID=A0A0Q3H360_BRADI|nr:hypothetical protein BRADI_1g33616v3 [Brachypodium distachyon]